MSLVFNGRIVSTNNPQVSITREEYEKLPQEMKDDPSITFFIIDDNDDDHKKLLELTSLIGSEEVLAKYADGTVLGAIKELYDRLGGLSFSVDPEFNHVEAKYSDENPNNDIQQLAGNANDSAKIAHLETIIGDAKKLEGTGYDSVVSAIVDLYGRLNNFAFAYNSETSTVEVKDLSE